MYSYLHLLVLSLCQTYFKCCDLPPFLLILSLHLRLEALQASLLFSKDYGLLSFLRKSLSSEEVHLNAFPGNNNVVDLNCLGVTETSFFQLRETRVDILCFLEKFLDRVSPRVKGWERTYAVDIRVSPRLEPHWMCFFFSCGKICEILTFFFTSDV